MERKLAAIFSTDVKGYSRLMGDDEEATIHTVTTHPTKDEPRLLYFATVSLHPPAESH